MEDYWYASDIDDSSMEEEGLIRKNHQQPRKQKRKHNLDNNNNNNNDNDNDDDNNNDDSRFKSKNLGAERRRRAKLSDRLLLLRTSVPIITNMTKAAIIKDAITFIEELRREVDELSNELLELGTTTTTHPQDVKPIINQKDNNAAEEMKAWGIQGDVKVIGLDEKKIWVKVVCQKRRGGLTRLVEALTNLGFHFNDINLTTSKGAAVIICCLEGVCGGGRPDIEETKELIKSVVADMEMINPTTNVGLIN